MTKPTILLRALALNSPSFNNCFTSLLLDADVEELSKIEVIKLLVLNNLHIRLI